MLTRLSVRDVVLIEKLDLDFAGGFCAFTGETGAGKSILLDSLALAIGARSDSGLVRHGAEKLSVTAEFYPVPSDIETLLDEQDIKPEDGEALILRRVVSADGRSKAFVNDRAVSASLLKQIGERLVEIHGQFATHGLLNPAAHRDILDAYGRLDELAGQCRKAYSDWQDKIAARQKAEEILQKARADEDFLRSAVAELKTFAPQSGEEDALAQKRALMMNGERLAESLNGALEALRSDELDRAVRTARRQTENAARLVENRYDGILTALDQANEALNEAANALETECAEVDFDPREQEAVEERLYGLRSLARKYQTSPNDLPALADEFSDRLAALDRGGTDAVSLAKEEEKARLTYLTAARALSDGRKKAAAALDAAVKNELAPLKLEKATFSTQIDTLPESLWSADGFDKVCFTASTNAGVPPAPLNKIASGGELARFMLALKVNLAEAEKIPTLVFDEVDSAVGGATASAIGERLARLAREGCQVLAITHSPQVASFARNHFRVRKGETDGKTVTETVLLSAAESAEEIARMLSGAAVTDASRAAARELLKNRT